jgi:UDP-3-O-[3-hydroxymyristoyl] glucosamine N-acyltransferase
MRVKEIAAFLASRFEGDGDIEITRAADITGAASGDLAFVEKGREIIETQASCVIVPEDHGELGFPTVIYAANPKLSFAKAAALLHPQACLSAGIHPTAVIASSAEISGDAYIGPFVSIGDGSTVGAGSQIFAGARVGRGVKIGSECVIHPNVCIEDNCSVSDRVILHAGVVIGADGFGFVRDEAGSYHKFPQIGTVIIENDVEIGANTCIDRGALGETRIGEGTKIDNLVQVGHNVSIGKRCVIAAQTGISGSVVIEDDCVIGGQVGFGDHVRVQSGAVIGSQAGVLPGKIVRPGVWWGTPIQPLDEYKRQNARIKGLSRLNDRVKKLEES